MRPTDENQHGSTRPNLLSGARRRFSDDDNILARLERDSERQAQGNRSRAAWQAIAAALILLVVVCVTWIAYQNFSTSHARRLANPARDVGGAANRNPAAAAMAPVVTTDARPAGAPDAAKASSSPPSQLHERGNSVAALPPLVLLPGPGIHALQPAVSSKRAEAVEPARDVHPPAAHARASAPPAVAPARATPRPVATPRTRKPVPADALPAVPVDADVALLSAIIIHDSAHAKEKAQLDADAACARAGERRCTRKMSP